MIEIRNFNEQFSRASARAAAGNLTVEPSTLMRQYRVTNNDPGAVYRVDFFRAHDGRKFVTCECAGGQGGHICKHAAMALPVHIPATLSFYCGMRACEIKALRWMHVDWNGGIIMIRRSKTPAGWRNPTMNETCRSALDALHARALSINAVEPDHFVFPWHGREQKIDPTKPITSWRTAWRSILKRAGLTNVRFHDGRHTAITTLAEKGLPDWVIQAQVRHVDPQMMKTYSHIRRRALDQAAAALEPSAINESLAGEDAGIH